MNNLEEYHELINANEKLKKQQDIDNLQQAFNMLQKDLEVLEDD